MKKDIVGSKGGEQRTPVEAPNTLRSIAIARIVDLVSEGEIVGLVDGLKSVYLNETPIQNSDGTNNFDNVRLDLRFGTQTQDIIAGFPGVESEVAVATELKDDTPVVRSLTNIDLSAVRVRLSVLGLSENDVDTGDTNGYRVDYEIDVATDGGPFVTKLRGAFDGKTMSKYERSHRVELPPATIGWDVRIRRTTPNAEQVNIQDTTYVEALTEIIDVKLRYPNSALVGLTLDASQFQSVPGRAYHMRGRLVRVPTNYDPETRVYTGLWDGTYKVAYSNNPAWAFLDLATHTRYGLGDRITDAMINKWELYRIAKYCDEMVDDGFGGLEPRFTCNLYLQSQNEAYKVLQNLATVFRGITYWGNGEIVTTADMPEDPVYTYTSANVVDGLFSYQGSAGRTRHTVALVSWNDMDDLGRAKVEYVDDQDGIARFGIQQTDMTAIACTSQGQAQRLGRYALLTAQYETDTVSFTVGPDATLVAPGKIIRIADPLRAGKRMGGRISAATTTVITVDADVQTVVGDELTVIDAAGVATTRAITVVNGRQLTVSPAFDAAPIPESVWTIDQVALQTQRARVLSITENSDGLSWNITAVRHVPSKFTSVDTGTKIDIRPTTGVNTRVCAAPSNVLCTVDYNVGAVNTSAVMNISWDASPDAAAYEVEYRRDNGQWVKLPETIGLLAEIRDAWMGTYDVRLKARNIAGVYSGTVLGGPFVVGDQSTPPTIVTGIIEDVTVLDTNLAQEIQDRIQDVLDEATDRTNAIAAEATARTNAIAQEAIDRNAAILVETNAREQALIDEGTARATAIAQEVIDRNAAIQVETDARIDALLSERLAWEAGVSTEATLRQTEDESLATAISLVSAGSGQQFDSKKIWYWDTDLEAWVGNGTPTVVDGWLRPANHATNPYVQSPDNLAINGGSYRFAKLRIKKVGNPTWRGELWWTTTTDTVFNSTKSATIAEPAFNPDGTTTVDWDDIAWWPNTIKQLRLRLSSNQTATDYYLMDWIAIGRPTPGAGVALVQEETSARVQADAAEAQQRTTLATQMRGSYEGTDVALLSSGLVYSERQARTTAISAEASSRTALSTKITGVADPSALTLTSLSAGLLYDERQARSTADSTEVTKREGLSATLTGFTNPDGKVLSDLTQGIIFEEKTARVTAVSAEASSRQALSTKLVGVADPSSLTLATISAGLLFDEKEARSTADSTEVTKREGLSATLTGFTDPTNKTLDELASGLLFEELSARVSADNAQVDRIFTMEARMPAGAGALATNAQVTDLQQVVTDGDSANATNINKLTAEMGLRMPSTFEQGSLFFTNQRHGDPAVVPEQPGTVVNDATLGSKALEISNWTIAGHNILTRGVVPAVAGRIYRVTARFRWPVAPADASADFNLVVAGLGNDYALIQTTFWDTLTVNNGGATTIVGTFGSAVGNGADFAWPTGSNYLRFGLRLGTAETGLVIRIAELLVEDITDAQINALAIESTTARINDTGNGESIESMANTQSLLSARVNAVETPNPNLVPNPTAAVDTTGWSGTGLVRGVRSDLGTYFTALNQNTVSTKIYQCDITVNWATAYTLAMDAYVSEGAVGNYYVDVICLDAASAILLDDAGTPLSIGWNNPTFTFTAPAGTVTIRIRVVCNNATFAQLIFKRIKLEVGTVATPYSNEAATAADASVLKDTTARINNTGNGKSIETVASDLVVMQGEINHPTTGLGTRASATDVTNIVNRINDVDGAGTTVESLATHVSVLDASLTGGGNLLPNSGFTDYTSPSVSGASTIPGWSIAGNNQRMFYGETGTATAFIPNGMNGAVLRTNTGVALAAAEFMDARLEPGVPIEPGKDYIASVYSGRHRCTAHIYMRFYDTAGVYISDGDNPTSDEANSTQPGGELLTNFKRIWRRATAPANAATVQIWLRGAADGSVGVDSFVFWIRPMLEQVSTTQALPSAWVASASGMATARALSVTTATVTAQGDTISGHTASITNLQNALGGANAEAFSSLKTEVDGWGDVGAILPTKASATALTALEARLEGGNANLVLNPSAGVNIDYWQPSYGLERQDVEGQTRFHFVTTSTSQHIVNYFHKDTGNLGVPVRPGATHYSARAELYNGAANTGDFYFQLHFMDAVGGNLGTINSSMATPQDAWQLVTLEAAPVPVGAAFVRLRLYRPVGGNSGANLYFRRVKVEEGLVVTGYNEDSASAKVAELMTAEVDTLTGEVHAMWSVTLDVNGHITGVVFANDGTTGGAMFNADYFGVTSASGNKMQWDTTAGVLYARRAATSKDLQIGAGFGSDTDKLVIYYGASGTSDSRTLSGSIFGITETGRAKFGGTGANPGGGWSVDPTITWSAPAAGNPATVTINVAAGTYVSSGFAVSYNASSVQVSQMRIAQVTYYLYYDDGGMTGGTKTLLYTTSRADRNTHPDYVLVGEVTIVVPPAGQVGSGGGTQFEP